jgi:Rhodanese-like domain
MLSDKLERTLNVATLAVAIAGIVACIQLIQYKQTHPATNTIGSAIALSSKPANPLTVGTMVRLQAEDWMKNGQTAVFILSTQCHWCSLSAPDYRAVLLYLRQNKIRTLAAFPENMTATQQYLSEHNLTFDAVRQVDLGRLGVSVTPTLLVVDQYGKVAGEWVGKPTLQQITEFKQLVRPPDVSTVRNGVTFLNAAALSNALSQHNPNKPVIVDLDPREDFAKGHIAGAINIQVDEIAIRAVHEIPKQRPLVIYCHKCAACEAHLGKDELSGYCDVGNRLLAMSGFKQTTFVMDNLTEISKAGVPINALTYNGQWR